MQATTGQNESSAFARFMASGYGRWVRVAFGATMTGVGLTIVPSPQGWFVAALGLLPMATGMFNLCPVAPLWGGHFIGAKYCAARSPRATTEKEPQ